MLYNGTLKMILWSLLVVVVFQLHAISRNFASTLPLMAWKFELKLVSSGALHLSQECFSCHKVWLRDDALEVSKCWF